MPSPNSALLRLARGAYTSAGGPSSLICTPWSIVTVTQLSPPTSVPPGNRKAALGLRTEVKRVSCAVPTAGGPQRVCNPPSSGCRLPVGGGFPFALEDLNRSVQFRERGWMRGPINSTAMERGGVRGSINGLMSLRALAEAATRRLLQRVARVQMKEIITGASCFSRSGVVSF